jgi:hypothetical protein
MQGLLEDSHNPSSRNHQSKSSQSLNSPSNIIADARSLQLHKTIDLNRLGNKKADLQKINEKRDISQLKNTIKEIMPGAANTDKMKQLGFLNNGKQHLDSTIPHDSSMSIKEKMTYA